MGAPEVSVMMPAYNRSDLIGHAIESVQAQSFPAWELVIIDDGSTDTTLTVARRYASADERIKVFANPQNLGIGKTRNHALTRCTGRFVTPLDSDDWYHPQRLERLLTAADDHNADLLADDLLIIRDGEQLPLTTLTDVCRERIVAPMHIDMAALLRRLGFERDGIALGLTKPFIRRSFLVDHGIGYDTTLQVVEDFWILADCVAAGAKFIMMPDAYYYYRLHRAHSTITANAIIDLEGTRRRLEELLSSDVALRNADAAHFARYHLQRMNVLLAYAEVVRSIRARHLDKATRQALTRPAVLLELAARLPDTVRRRIRARRGDPYAFDPLIGVHRSRTVPSPLPHPPPGSRRQAVS